jgi:8-oxo-dGTP pyrophosphatase MutT (NUDIX family)
MIPTFIRQLEDRLAATLPGMEAQRKMAHITRHLYTAAPTTARQAAVMALLFRDISEWRIVLIERNRNDRDHHAGQIGFPGGKAELSDTCLQHTALRETEEEIGVSADSIRVIGRLSDLYIPVSNFQVHPFVGYLDTAPSYVLQPEEVQHAFDVPFDLFFRPERRKLTDIRLAPRLTLKNVPYFDVEGKVLWGATAMIISELIHITGPLSHRS